MISLQLHQYTHTHTHTHTSSVSLSCMCTLTPSGASLLWSSRPLCRLTWLRVSQQGGRAEAGAERPLPAAAGSAGCVSATHALVMSLSNPQVSVSARPSAAATQEVCVGGKVCVCVFPSACADDSVHLWAVVVAAASPSAGICFSAL